MPATLTELVRQLRGHFLGRTELGEVVRMWHDDFGGDSIDARWNSSPSAGGSLDLQDSSPSRILMDTGIVASSVTELNEGGFNHWAAADRITVRVRSKMSGTATIRHIPILLDFDASNRVLIEYNTGVGDTGWVLRTIDGGTTTTSAVIQAADTNWNIFWLALETGLARARIEGVAGVKENSANVPTEDLTFRTVIVNNTGASRTSEVDYVTIWPGKVLF